MYIEVGRRQSGKTRRLIEDAIDTLRKHVNSRVLIVSPHSNMSRDIQHRVKKLLEARFLTFREYGRIEFRSAGNRNWFYGENSLKYKKIYFDEFAFFDNLVPVENGYYVSAPGNIYNLRLLTRYTGGKYYVRKISFKFLKKEHKRKGKTNLSGQR